MTDLQRVKDIVSPIAEKYGIARMSLFGSRARGEERPDSDYDIWVSGGNIRGLGLGGLASDLEDALGTDVDILTDTCHQPDPEILEAVRADEVLLYSLNKDEERGAPLMIKPISQEESRLRRAKRDRNILGKILKYCGQVAEPHEFFHENKELFHDKRTNIYRNAITMPILQIGELAKSLSPEMREKHPDVPWRDIIRMRDRMAHHYEALDLDVVWDISLNDIPALAEAVKRILEEAEKMK